MQEYSRNYQLAGGKVPFSDYYTADSEWAVFRRHLSENVVFGTHNLVSDASFNEFHVILCRNHNDLLPARTARDRCINSFTTASSPTVISAWAKSETVRVHQLKQTPTKPLDARERLFRKIK